MKGTYVKGPPCNRKVPSMFALPDRNRDSAIGWSKYPPRQSRIGAKIGPMSSPKMPQALSAIAQRTCACNDPVSASRHFAPKCARMTALCERVCKLTGRRPPHSGLCEKEQVKRADEEHVQLLGHGHRAERPPAPGSLEIAGFARRGRHRRRGASQPSPKQAQAITAITQ